MKKYKVLGEYDGFEVVEVEGLVGLKTKSVSVAVMPYTVDENGMIKEVGLLKEFNPFREDNYAMTLITGTIEDEDEAILNTAYRELREEGGYTLPGNETMRWIYLGSFYPYKDSDREVPTFAVDVTGITPEEPKTDGSEKEKKSKFAMISANDIMTTEEALPLTAFLRLFNYFFLKSTGYV